MQICLYVFWLWNDKYTKISIVPWILHCVVHRWIEYVCRVVRAMKFILVGNFVAWGIKNWLIINKEFWIFYNIRIDFFVKMVSIWHYLLPMVGCFSFRAGAENNLFKIAFIFLVSLHSSFVLDLSLSAWSVWVLLVWCHWCWSIGSSGPQFRSLFNDDFSFCVWKRMLILFVR